MSAFQGNIKKSSEVFWFVYHDPGYYSMITVCLRVSSRSQDHEQCPNEGVCTVAVPTKVLDFPTESPTPNPQSNLASPLALFAEMQAKKLANVSLGFRPRINLVHNGALRGSVVIFSFFFFFSLFLLPLNCLHWTSDWATGSWHVLTGGSPIWLASSTFFS